MTLEEAQKVLDSVNNDLLPPTNPAVLLEAARTLYLEHQPHRGMVSILIWTLNIISINSRSEITDEQNDMIGDLLFAEKVK